MDKDLFSSWMGNPPNDIDVPVDEGPFPHEDLFGSWMGNAPNDGDAPADEEASPNDVQAQGGVLADGLAMHRTGHDLEESDDKH